MNKLHLAAVLLGAGLALSAMQAQACGESMFKSGQAMRYRSFISRHPAQIMIYRPVAEGAVSQQLYSGLEKAGHTVTVVTDVQALAQALGSRKFDVIIAAAPDVQVVAAQMHSVQHAPTLLAVADGRDVRDAATPLRASDGTNAYLKTIEETMRMRGG